MSMFKKTLHLGRSVGFPPNMQIYRVTCFNFSISHRFSELNGFIDYCTIATTKGIRNNSWETVGGILKVHSTKLKLRYHFIAIFITTEIAARQQIRNWFYDTLERRTQHTKTNRVRCEWYQKQYWMLSTHCKSNALFQSYDMQQKTCRHSTYSR